MEVYREFTFKGQLFSCDICIDDSPDPGFIFVELWDTELSNVFGREFSIRTNFEQLLAFEDDLPESLELIELKLTIFNSICTTPDFTHAKLRLQAFNTQAPRLMH